ncbi:LytTR family DNA-binding domain-containing protein [Hydrogenibacillus sp. N12]|uniref:LytTR family DNA-binding domain-containing protein n=1 Tax=Hydrogenibacillus sp. N12 TaxID=2866627 RepID=UPI00207BFE99|nr:LytTR family DNA-binding domain-containing protein [Hydrogenibacillus sp. N12]
MDAGAVWAMKLPSVVIADEDRYVYYRPSPFIDLHIRPGDPIKPDSVTEKALRLNREVAEPRDERLFGVAYFGFSVPLTEAGRRRGAVTLVFPLADRERAGLPPKGPFLTVWSRERWIPLDFEDVIYLEAQNRKTFVRAMDVQGMHRESLSSLEASLPADRFARIHRAYIVNVRQIAEIHPYSHSTLLLVMRDGSRLPVSRTYAPLLRQRLGF